MKDKFSGDWQVVEYIYSPEGEFLGKVFQRRQIEPIENDTFRVTQECHPQSEVSLFSTFEKMGLYDNI